MPDAFRIHRIAPADLGQFRSLLRLFGEVFGEPETYGGRPPGDDYVHKLLGCDHFIALAALCDDEVVGGLAAYELQKFEQERSEIYIYDLAVAESQRRRGIATALIEALRAIAVERGAYVIFVQADRGDEAAIALYAELGVREDVLHFDIDVPGPGGVA